MSTSITQQLAAYERMDVPQLAAEYERLYGAKPRCRHKVWLRRNCAWRAQELALGGLSDAAKARLDVLMAEITIPGIDGATTAPTRARDPADPPVGTTLVKEWRGQQVRVAVLADGYEWNGAKYKSLSAVARAITHVRWNGRAFFNVPATGTRR